MFLMPGRKKRSLSDSKKEENPKHKNWENPVAPEEPKDEREVEKIERRKKEAERQLKNLRSNESGNKTENK